MPTSRNYSIKQIKVISTREGAVTNADRDWSNNLLSQEVKYIKSINISAPQGTRFILDNKPKTAGNINGATKYVTIGSTENFCLEVVEGAQLNNLNIDQKSYSGVALIDLVLYDIEVVDENPVFVFNAGEI